MRWRRAERYELCDVPLASAAPMLGRVVRAIRPVGELHEYDVDAPRLYREFANLPTSEAAFLNFAARYGLLGGLGDLNRDKDETAEPIDWFGWSDEKMEVGLVLNAWDLLNGDARRVSEGAFEWSTKGLSTKEKRQRLSDKIVNGINEARRRHAMRPHLRASRLRTDTIEFVDDHQPETLIQLIWTQVIEAITRRKDFVPCRNSCGQWVERAPGKRGPRQEFCSVKCRVAYDQRAVSDVKRMARKGDDASTIAEATGLPVGRVRRIIASQRSKRS